MAYKSFQEYLDHKNKLWTTGKVEKVSDYTGPNDTKPPKGEMPKDAGGKGESGSAAPYASGSAKKPAKGEKGFADEGPKDLVYKPKTDVPTKVGEGGKKVASWPKTKTQEWLDDTRGMSLAEFTKKLRSEATQGLDECACQGASSPFDSVKKAANLCKCNRNILAAFVREMKRNESFTEFVAELLQHPETYVEMAKLMEDEDGSIYARRLVRAMNEMVAPPAHDEDEEDELEPGTDDMGDEPPMDDLEGEGPPMDMPMPPPKKKKKKKKPHAHNHMLDAMKDNPMMAGDMKAMMSSL